MMMLLLMLLLLMMITNLRSAEFVQRAVKVNCFSEITQMISYFEFEGVHFP